MSTGRKIFGDLYRERGHSLRENEEQKLGEEENIREDTRENSGNFLVSFFWREHFQA